MPIKKAVLKKEAAKKAVVKKPAAKKPAGKKAMKQNDKLVCQQCGLVVTVDNVCGCIDVCDLICCGTEMKPKRK